MTKTLKRFGLSIGVAAPATLTLAGSAGATVTPKANVSGMTKVTLNQGTIDAASASD